MNIVHTTGTDPRFIQLCKQLDDFLNDAVGGEAQRSQYNQYNTLDEIHDVILFLDNDMPIACGAIRDYEPQTAELKRLFVASNYRKHGIGKPLLVELEALAVSKGYHRLILETGAILNGAMTLYSHNQYHIIKNYGPYKDMPNSICMGKIL